MVISEYRFICGKGKIIVHYCNICGTHYLNMEEAENCECCHKSNVPHSENSDAINSVNNQDNTFVSNGIDSVNPKHEHHDNNVIKYRAFVRGSHGERNHEFNVEARNIKEAASKVREKFPRHSGYTLKPVN